MSRRGGSHARDPDFLLLWIGQTVSVFGSLVTRTALPFTAILVLHASPFQMSLLAAADLAPGLVLGLLAGAWVDRLRRRPILIAADLVRALLLVSIPFAAFTGVLRLEQLFLVALLTGACTVCFDVAYHAYLPGLVPRPFLLEANRRIAASSSVAEVAAFGATGWLVQWFTAPFALLIDAATFVVSALSLGAIRRPEPVPAPPERHGVLREIREGVRAVAGDPMLRALAGASVTREFTFGMAGALYMLFVTEGLGFRPGVLGTIFAVGGLSSLLGAIAAGPLARRLGAGRAMGLGLLAAGAGLLLVPAARGATLLAAALLVLQQVVSDAGAVVYDVHQTSLRQTLSPEALRGRIHASVHFLGLAAMLVGSLAAGALATGAGLRAALVVAAVLRMAAALWLWRSPVWRLRAATEAGPVAG